MSHPDQNKHLLPERPGQWAALAHDVAVSAVVMAAVLIWRYRFEPKPLPQEMVIHATVAFTAACAFTFPAFHLHRGLWKYTAINDMLSIGRAVAVANLVLVPVLFLMDRLTDFPRTGILIEGPLLVVILCLSRLLVRGWRRGDLAAALRPEDEDAPWAVIVADLATAARYLADQNRQDGSRRRIAGIITPDGSQSHGRIDGAEVLGGLDRLEEALAAAAETSRDIRVVIAEMRPGRALLQQVMTAAARTGARVERRRASGASLSSVEAADLLDRPPRSLDLGAARALVSHRRILVTGAGGTIGSELTRQILELEPALVVLVDASEYNLYAIDQALTEAGSLKVWKPELGDVRDRTRMAQLFERYRPDVVLHAAALKHVPLMEANPAEAVLTNIGGARIVAELARQSACAFVFISTDKAVNPTNVMGATKRIAEQVTRAICASSGIQGSEVPAAIVRFGNVLGSTGSVVPLFERQIAEGGPITITHPDMVRYFMTVQEAASLVLQAAALPARENSVGGVFVLDMGEPVRIEDLARQMIQMHGLRPGLDIAIHHTGLRPGEKLFEEIFYAAEQVHPTGVDGVFSAFEPPRDWDALRPQVERLISAAAHRDETATLQLLAELVPEFHRAGTPN